MRAEFEFVEEAKELADKKAGDDAGEGNAGAVIKDTGLSFRMNGKGVSEEVFARKNNQKGKERCPAAGNGDQSFQFIGLNRFRAMHIPSQIIPGKDGEGPNN